MNTVEGALRFKDNYVRILDDPTFDITTTLTVSVFVKNDEVSLSTDQAIIGKYDINNKCEWQMYACETSKLRIYFSSDGANLDYWESTNTLTWNLWNHILFTYNAGTVKVYLNGKSFAGDWNGAGVNSINNDDANVYIGCLCGILDCWCGIVDGCRIWNRVLSQVEARNEYNKKASQVIFSFNVKDEQRGNHPPVGWSDENGNIIIGQDADGLYVQAFGGSDVLSWCGVDLSNFEKNGFVKQIKGDMDFDGNMPVDDTGRISFSDNILSIAFKANEKLRSITITGGVRTFDDGRNWAQKMVDSYKSTHETLPDGVEDELLSRLQPDEYLHNIFGPGVDAQNKTKCDFILAFKFTANLTTRTWTKSGDVLRWDVDGTIYDDPSNDFPTHTKGAGAGILTVSTTDGWSGLTSIDLMDNPLSGMMPNLSVLGFDNLTYLRLLETDLFGNFDRFNEIVSLTEINIRYTNISDDISKLSTLINSEVLHMGYPWTDKIYGDIIVLGYFPNLRVANFDYSTSVFGNLSVFEDLVNVTYIGLRSINLVEGNIYHLRNRTDMTHIGLSSPLIYGNTSYLSGLIKLTFLTLASRLITGSMEDFQNMIKMINFNIGCSEANPGQIGGNVSYLSGWTVIQIMEMEWQAVVGNVSVFDARTTFHIFNIRGTALTGSLNFLQNSASLHEVQTRYATNGLTITVNIFNISTKWAMCRGMDWDEAQVDRILGYYKDLSDAPGLDMNVDYYINLSDSNDPPSAAGLADKATLEAIGGWTGGSMTIQVSS